MYKECINVRTLLAEKAVINFDTHINTIRAYGIEHNQLSIKF